MIFKTSTYCNYCSLPWKINSRWALSTLIMYSSLWLWGCDSEGVALRVWLWGCGFESMTLMALLREYDFDGVALMAWLWGRGLWLVNSWRNNNNEQHRIFHQIRRFRKPSSVCYWCRKHLQYNNTTTGRLLCKELGSFHFWLCRNPDKCPKNFIRCSCHEPRGILRFPPVFSLPTKFPCNSLDIGPLFFYIYLLEFRCPCIFHVRGDSLN